MGLIAASAFPLRVAGSRITGADGSAVRLCGVNWGGAQQDEMLPYGLDVLPRQEIIARIAGWGMNHVRFPVALGTAVSSDGSLKTAPAKASRLAANPDLQGLTPWAVYKQLVADMTAAGLYVIVNKHLSFPGWCCSTDDNNGLWYNDNWPSSVFTNWWVMAAQAFAANPRVGYDLHNEPRAATIGGTARTPTWGSGGNGGFPTDFRQMYQNTIGRIRQYDPDALCFCEGLKYASDLTGWKTAPVTGAGVVASMHDYSWFHAAGQSLTDYYNQMDAAAGYLVTGGTAPLWIGEFGANTDAGGAALNTGWLPQFLSWAQARGVHTCWWELDATSVLGTEPVTGKVKAQPGQRESYGLMSGQDWAGSQAAVLAMLAPLMS